MLHSQLTINCRGKLLDLTHPMVMGILNATPDSFFDGGKHNEITAALHHCEAMLTEGASIIDVGGMSSRPGANIIDEAEELKRVLPLIGAIAKAYPSAVISIDTVRASVAVAAVDSGAAIVNDISAGRIDPGMYATVGNLGVPYVLMHMQGMPSDMQKKPDYKDVVQEVLDFLIQETGKLLQAGVKDIIIDPGFGFGKTVAHNYELLKKMHILQVLEKPILAGISRKSMICKVLNLPPSEALNGTSALHMVALQQGARILRAHDVKEAMQVIKLWKELEAV